MGVNKADLHLKYPFIHERAYRLVAARVTGCDLSSPDLVLAPLIDEYARNQDRLFAAVSKDASPERNGRVALLKDKPWWWLMPTLLPPFQSHHEAGMLYTVYRQMTTGNMTFLVGRELARALYNTDYEVKVGDLKFPSSTFIVYFQDSIAPVGPSHLTWIFVDRPGRETGGQLRIVYGFIDEDGDEANSDFLLFDGADDQVLRNDEIMQQMESQKVSTLSLNPVTDIHRRNVASVFASLINFLLYLEAVNDTTVIPPVGLQNPSSGLRNAKKLRRREKEAEDHSLYQYTYVGRSYEARMDPSQQGLHLEHRVLVRGHWRHQWSGSQRDEAGTRVPGTDRKLAWIEPYWKGPDIPAGKLSVRVVR